MKPAYAHVSRICRRDAGDRGRTEEQDREDKIVTGKIEGRKRLELYSPDDKIRSQTVSLSPMVWLQGG